MCTAHNDADMQTEAEFKWTCWLVKTRFQGDIKGLQRADNILIMWTWPCRY